MTELLKPILRDGTSTPLRLRQMLPFSFLSSSFPKPSSVFVHPSHSPKEALSQSFPRLSNKKLSSASTAAQSHGSSSSTSSLRSVEGVSFDPKAVSQNHGLPAIWLQSCSCAKDVQKVHALVLKSLGSVDTYTNNNLVTGYYRFGRLGDARKVFDEMQDRNVVSWTAMINGYIWFGLEDEALRLFLNSFGCGVRANCKTYVCVLNICSKRTEFELGRQIHASVMKTDSRNLIVDSALVHFYAKCGELESSFCMFDQMIDRDVVTWTTMISACAQHGHKRQALLMFLEMLRDGLLPNEYTVCSILNVSGELKALEFGRQLHGAIVKKMVKYDVFVGTSLVDMYAKCGEIIESRKVFVRMRNRNTVTWTSLIAGYARKGLGEEAIALVREMKRKNIFANNMTIVSILLACGSLRNMHLGREIHAQIVRKFMQTNIHISSTLVWLYCKCGKYSYASNVLQKMPFRDVVSWTSLISGCADLGQEAEALELLKRMLEEGVEPNSFTYSSALKACAKLEAGSIGRLIHSSANKKPAMSNVFVGSALIHMYSKCGFLSEAIRVFDGMPERNLVTWKSMIMGYARNGQCQEALKLLYRMRAEGIEVDDYVLAAVLTECGGVQLDMEPSAEHCLQSTRC
ncbi:hypothetical protein CDL15_Pgr006223 [Punica granatum]|uniref:Pentatricopeptide repeat-containing protein At4g18520, chloroplastic n=2 Tax=Punica granatum TaxID=22663 RepID=A0A218X5A9_PUNGR|nr:hypothetical protein CDL15_Pgr006223 [Punica granatum]